MLRLVIYDTSYLIRYVESLPKIRNMQVKDDCGCKPREGTSRKNPNVLLIDQKIFVSVMLNVN